MKARFCRYCGGPIGECDCEKEAALEYEELVEELENSPETQLGWADQDLIENSHFYQR